MFVLIRLFEILILLLILLLMGIVISLGSAGGALAWRVLVLLVFLLCFLLVLLILRLLIILTLRSRFRILLFFISSTVSFFIILRSTSLMLRIYRPLFTFPLLMILSASHTLIFIHSQMNHLTQQIWSSASSTDSINFL